MKISLATPFLYQNPTTGSPSTTTLTCTQLCRLLCGPTTSFLNPSTRILGYDSISQSYDSDGWKEARTVDVLREACDSWYYESAAATTTATRGVIEGPISTRALAKLYHQNNNCGEDNHLRIAGTTRVYRNKQEGWKQIDQLDHLQLAMEAFREVVVGPPAVVQQDDGCDGRDDVAAIAMTTVGRNHNQNANDNDSNVNNAADGIAAVDQMIFDNNDDEDEQEATTTNHDDIINKQQQREREQNVADELEAFLSSTDHLAPHASTNTGGTKDNDDDDDQEEYESDGGTRYIRDCQSGNWIHEHEAVMMQRQRGGTVNDVNKNGTTTIGQSSSNNDKNVTEATTTSSSSTTTTTKTKKRKRKKPKFSAKSARNWIYVTGLPLDTTEEELSKYFSKVGIIDIDPESLKPKIKLYRHKKKQLQTCASGEESHGSGGGGGGELKGDASICYARPESVELALQILDENLFRDGAILSVQRAKFEQHGSTFDMDKSGGNGGVGGKRRIISESKRRVARLAAIQAVGWDESENGRIAGGLKGLRIIVLMNMFDPRELEHDDDDDDDDDNNGDENTGDTRLHALEREIHTECEEIGTVEKITIFSKHPAGVVIVKFVKPNDASDAVKAFNGKVKGNGRKVEASFWDGTTDYTVVDVEKEEKEAEKRLDKFGDWLEEQELPEEFQLRVEEKD
ncbi:TatSF1-like protein [Skeletonema marinoi]|uniref:TatSF1-like protein n=1 Tax=Skeletonema marinoi TaxID=267567 RepID=A0AAD9D9E3_9STRA|nr:TatSF1-like protein [Skeletonema marinoi]